MNKEIYSNTITSGALDYEDNGEVAVLTAYEDTAFYENLIVEDDEDEGRFFVILTYDSVAEDCIYFSFKEDAVKYCISESAKWQQKLGMRLLKRIAV